MRQLIRIKQEVDEEANIIYGTTCDDRLDGIGKSKHSCNWY